MVGSNVRNTGAVVHSIDFKRPFITARFNQHHNIDISTQTHIAHKLHMTYKINNMGLLNQLLHV